MDYKLQAVKYAAQNQTAEIKFGENEKLVKVWRRAEVNLATIKKTKKKEIWRNKSSDGCLNNMLPGEDWNCAVN